MPKTSGNDLFPRLESEARQVVDHAVENNLSVVTSLEGFTTKADMLVLRDMLRYAASRGITVVFMPVDSSLELEA